MTADLVLKDRQTSVAVGVGDRRRTMIGRRAEVVITALSPPLDGGEG